MRLSLFVRRSFSPIGVYGGVSADGGVFRSSFHHRVMLRADSESWRLVAAMTFEMESMGSARIRGVTLYLLERAVVTLRTVYASMGAYKWYLGFIING